MYMQTVYLEEEEEEEEEEKEEEKEESEDGGTLRLGNYRGNNERRE